MNFFRNALTSSILVELVFLLYWERLTFPCGRTFREAAIHAKRKMYRRVYLLKGGKEYGNF